MEIVLIIFFLLPPLFFIILPLLINDRKKKGLWVPSYKVILFVSTPLWGFFSLFLYKRNLDLLGEIVCREKKLFALAKEIKSLRVELEGSINELTLLKSELRVFENTYSAQLQKFFQNELVSECFDYAIIIGGVSFLAAWWFYNGINIPNGFVEGFLQKLGISYFPNPLSHCFLDEKGNVFTVVHESLKESFFLKPCGGEIFPFTLDSIQSNLDRILWYDTKVFLLTSKINAEEALINTLKQQIYDLTLQSENIVTAGTLLVEFVK